MKLRMLRGIIALFFISATVGLNAQEYDVDYTVDYINKNLDEKCKLFSEKKNLRIEYYAHGEAVRMDFIFPESIDFEEGVYHSEGEKAVIVSCYEKAGKCIERDIIKRNSKILYDRSNLTTTCTDCSGVVEAMKHLIQLYVMDDVQRTEPFE